VLPATIVIHDLMMSLLALVYAESAQGLTRRRRQQILRAGLRLWGRRSWNRNGLAKISPIGSGVLQGMKELPLLEIFAKVEESAEYAQDSIQKQSH